MSQAASHAGLITERRTQYRWIILALIFLIYAIASADHANIGIASPHTKTEFNLTNTAVGAIVSPLVLAYGIPQTPSLVRLPDLLGRTAS